MTDIFKCKKIHFVGIGGCSMSGIALMIKSRGIEVQGSDIKESPFTRMLENQGVKVFIGHDAANIGDSDMIVYSASIRPENVERVYAKEHGIPEMERCDALGELSRGFREVVGVSGCHGKTTITSMLAMISNESKLDATVHVGGFVDFLGSGVHVGNHDTFITEACEYVESFLSLSPTVIILNNIDDDHLNYFKDIDHITEAFRKFIGLLPEDGYLIACTDDERVKKLYDEYKGIKVSYGMSNADYCPIDISYDKNGFTSFTLVCNKGKKQSVVGKFKLNIIGDFNIINAIAAILCSIKLGANISAIANGLEAFRPTRRRFEFFGERNGVKYYHDYAHHPGEINAVLNGASRCPHNKMWVVFQCNSYSRAKTLFLDDRHCFDAADEVLVLDIYPGRETDDGTVHATDMVNALKKAGVNTYYAGTIEKARERIDEESQSGDIVITLGSGDIFEKTEILLKEKE